MFSKAASCGLKIELSAPIPESKIKGSFSLLTVSVSYPQEDKLQKLHRRGTGRIPTELQTGQQKKGWFGCDSESKPQRSSERLPPRCKCENRVLRPIAIRLLASREAATRQLVSNLLAEF
jgi:hypothetical protein